MPSHLGNDEERLVAAQAKVMTRKRRDKLLQSETSAFLSLTTKGTPLTFRPQRRLESRKPSSSYFNTSEVFGGTAIEVRKSHEVVRPRLCLSVLPLVDRVAMYA